MADEAAIETPDIDDGEIDVERYDLPDASEITDPYLRDLWTAVFKKFQGGEYVGEEEASIYQET